MRRAALALIVACGWLTAAPAPLAAARTTEPSAVRADQVRDHASLTAQRRTSGGAARAIGRHGERRAGEPLAVVVPVPGVPPAVPAFAIAAAISPPPALAGQAIHRPGLPRGPPPSR